MGSVYLSIKMSRVAELFRRASDCVRQGDLEEADRLMRQGIREAKECPTYMSYLLPAKYNAKGSSEAYGGPMPGE